MTKLKLKDGNTAKQMYLVYFEDDKQVVNVQNEDLVKKMLKTGVVEKVVTSDEDDNSSSTNPSKPETKGES